MLLLEVRVGDSVDTLEAVITGFSGVGETVTVAVVALQPDAVRVKVKVTVPAETAVTNPLVALIVATPGVLLIQAPAVDGLSVMVAPTHKATDGVLTEGTTGWALIVMVDDAVETHPAAFLAVTV